MTGTTATERHFTTKPLSWNDVFPHWGQTIRTNPRCADVLSAEPRDEAEIAFAKIIESQAKHELHVHLEAAVPAAFYSALNRQQMRFEAHDEPAARAPFLDFGSFVKAWLDHASLVSQPDLLAHLGRAFVSDRATQNIVYSEVHTSAVDFSLMRQRFPRLGPPLDFASCLAAVCRGIGEGLREHPQIDVRLIVDLLWMSNPDEKSIMISALSQLLTDEVNTSPRGGPLIIGVGLGGPEPTSTEQVDAQRDALNRCRDLGLALDLHCGETATRATMEYALKTLTPDRIGHGIAGAPDLFFEGHTSTCPLSNIQTGVFPRGLAEHPLTEMLKRDLPFSVNTDDPLLFGTTLTLEYVALRRALGWGLEEFQKTQENARRGALGLRARARDQKSY